MKHAVNNLIMERMEKGQKLHVTFQNLTHLDSTLLKDREKLTSTSRRDRKSEVAEAEPNHDGRETDEKSLGKVQSPEFSPWWLK